MSIMRQILACGDSTNRGVELLGTSNRWIDYEPNRVHHPPSNYCRIRRRRDLTALRSVNFLWLRLSQDHFAQSMNTSE
jgi:hypothetical protein